MAGNSFGRIFIVTSFGESHGPAIGAIVDGAPAGMPLCVEDIQRDLDRRRPGQSDLTTPRAEKDRVEILSGVFDGTCMGTPIGLLIRNEEKRSQDYDELKDLVRPGHADWTWQAKHGVRDWRGGGRSSGRETAARVAAGAIARKLLASRGVTLLGSSIEIAGVRAQGYDPAVIEKNPVRCADPAAAPEMAARIREAQEAGDSVGGIVEVRVSGCPAGLGDPVFDKLEALLAHALMSVGGVRSVEVGVGVEAARMLGSRYNDTPFVEDGRVRTRTNNAGGVSGGISTGEDILLRAAIRPTASIGMPQSTIALDGSPRILQVKGRHDPCIVPRAVPVLEAMTALVVADCLLLQDRLGSRAER